jgi:hypothetical protein
MIRNFDHKFPLKSGVVAYVQDDRQRGDGYQLCDWIESRWSPPDHLYHFRAGGHVEAARLHQNAPFILGLDLRRFFDQVTRSKAHRALRQIGYSNTDAYKFASESTVSKSGRPGAYSLPFGFVQSMHLASLALHHSALGRAMVNVQRDGVNLSQYVDDLLLSANDADALVAARARLIRGADKAGFAFNDTKERGPANRIEAFNIHIGRGRLEVTNHRMADFRHTVREPPHEPALATIGYVRTVNVDQADDLAALRTAAGF